LIICDSCSKHTTRKLPFLNDYEDHRLCYECAKLLNRHSAVDYPLITVAELKAIELEWLVYASNNFFDKRNTNRKLPSAEVTRRAALFLQRKCSALDTGETTGWNTT
jgi:hypothetical protein